MSTNIIDFIINIVGKENVACKEGDLVCYSSDLAPLPETIIATYGVKDPSLIVRPKNSNHISEIIKLANKEKIPVTPRGGACSSHGGGLPIDGGIVIDMTSMDKVLSLSLIHI